MAWKIESAEDARRELLRIDRPVALRIRTCLTERLAPLDDKRSIGEALRGPELGAFWKYRVADWHVVMAGAGPPSTTWLTAAAQVVDGAPSRTMTRYHGRY